MKMAIIRHVIRTSPFSGVAASVVFWLFGRRQT